MGGFRRFVIGFVEFLQVLGIILITLFSAITGHFAMPASGVLIGGMDLLGPILGGLVGFTVSASLASLIFLLAEIAANTRKTALVFDSVGRSSNSPGRREPSLR
jgi:hypothetical protein